MASGGSPANGGDTAPSSSSGGHVETLKDTYIPVFTNRVADYREWRQRILLYKRKVPRQGERSRDQRAHELEWRCLAPSGAHDRLLGRRL